MVSLFSQYLYLACPNQSQSMFCSRRLHFLRKTISFPSHKQGSFSSSTCIISCSSTSWNPFQRVMAAALDKLEASMIASQLQHLPSTADPGIQLEGNFAPVEERGVEDEIEVKDGKIPECLEGVYVRNGANPMLQPLAGHHLFDGDGMLHALRFKHGKASYCCRFTRTNRLVQEEKMGKPIFPKAIGELHGHNGVGRLLLFYVRSLLGLVDGRQGMGTANAGVLFFNGRLLAMSEDDLPYAVRITSSGDLVTLGRYDFGCQLKSSMIAHPKIDAKTGEMFGLSYDVVKKPYLRYFKFSGDGVKSRDVAITLSEPTMIHDFAITENFVVIPDQQIVFRVQEMLRGGSPVVQNKSKVSRFGILPRNDSDESRIRWVEVPDCFCFHLWNAWEEGEEVVVIGSCMTPPDLIFNESPEQQPLRSVLSEIRVNRGRGTSERRVIVGGMNLEAGQVNGMVVGRKSRYAYMAIAEPWPKVCGIAKVDLVEMKVVGERRYEDGCYGGEPTFVANSHNIDAAEDNGFVLTFLHKEGSRESELLIMDAKSPHLHTIASLRLPSRVPYGFHGTFVSSQQLLHQKQTLL